MTLLCDDWPQQQGLLWFVLSHVAEFVARRSHKDWWYSWWVRWQEE